jgi:hypothetical protein
LVAVVPLFQQICEDATGFGGVSAASLNYPVNALGS